MMKLFMFLIMLNFLIIICEMKFLLFLLMNLLFMLMILFILNLNLSSVWMNIYGWLGMDNWSMILSLLTIWIIGIMYMVSIEFKNLK